MTTTISKRSTVYFAPDIHKALKLKAIQCGATLSDLVNQAVIQTFLEDREDIQSYEDRKHEPETSFEDVLRELDLSIET